MANYLVTRYLTPPGPLPVVLLALETQIETVVDTKTIRHFGVYHVASDTFIGSLVYDT